MKPEEVKSRLVEHPQIKAKIERGGQMVKIKLKAGDRIFVLPDPAYLVGLTFISTKLLLTWFSASPFGGDHHRRA